MAKSVPKNARIAVRQIRSRIGTLPTQRACLQGLGLRKIGHQRFLEDTPAIRGMMKKVEHLIVWEIEKSSPSVKKKQDGGSEAS